MPPEAEEKGENYPVFSLPPKLQSPPAPLMGKPGPELMVKGVWESELAAQAERDHRLQGCLNKQAASQHSL